MSSIIPFKFFKMSIQNASIAGSDEIIGRTEYLDGSNRTHVMADCKVSLMLQLDGSVCMTTRSDKDGNYSFKNINQKDFKYFIVAHDPLGKINGVIADNIGGKNVDD